MKLTDQDLERVARLIQNSLDRVYAELRGLEEMGDSAFPKVQTLKALSRGMFDAIGEPLKEALSALKQVNLSSASQKPQAVERVEAEQTGLAPCKYCGKVPEPYFNRLFGSNCWRIACGGDLTKHSHAIETNHPEKDIAIQYWNKLNVPSPQSTPDNAAQGKTSPESEKWHHVSSNYKDSDGRPYRTAKCGEVQLFSGPELTVAAAVNAHNASLSPQQVQPNSEEEKPSWAEIGRLTEQLAKYKAWADKATTQLCGDEPLDKMALVTEWEKLEEGATSSTDK